jgi:putative transposase
MLVMFKVTNPVERAHTMTRREGKGEGTDVKALVSADDAFIRSAVRTAIQAALEAEMTEALAAERSERVDGRLGYRSGFYSRSLITRVGTIELRVPRDRSGLFSTELFERYQRSERALVSALAEMYVQGVSTRKVKAVTEQLCGHSFSASSVSEMNKTLDAALTAFATRRLDEPYPYLILDARYERAREGGVIASQAALIAIAVDADGHRQVLAVELANRESTSSWRDFLLVSAAVRMRVYPARDGLWVAFASAGHFRAEGFQPGCQCRAEGRVSAIDVAVALVSRGLTGGRGGA